MSRLQTVAIVGGGITGWTVAAMLAQRLRGQNINITLLDCQKHHDFSEGCETTVPSIRGFNAVAGFNEQSLVCSGAVSYKLATCYDGWHDPSRSYFLPFAEHGFMLEKRDFSGYAMRCHASGNRTPYDAYSLSAVAARLGRFRHPSQKANSLYSTISYALHVNRTLYQQVMTMLAEQLGVRRVAGELNGISVDRNGSVGAVEFEDCGERHKIIADLYIDCTGQAGRVVGEALDVPYVSHTERLPVNRRATVLYDPQRLPPYTYLKPLNAGWLSLISTPRLCDTTYTFSREFATDTQAVQMLTDALGKQVQHAQFQPLQPGQRKEFWSKNCIAMGEAAGELGGFSIGQLHLTQSAVVRLLDLFPAGMDYDFQRQEYNRLTELEYQHVLDFHALHYRLVNSVDSPFWRAAQAVPLSETLSHKLELFDRRGVIPFYEGETFPASTWTSLLLGHEQWPKAYDPIVDQYDAGWVEDQLTRMEKLIGEAAQAMPAHEDYIRQYCSAPRSAG